MKLYLLGVRKRLFWKSTLGGKKGFRYIFPLNILDLLTNSGHFYAMKILNKKYIAKRNQKLYTKAERQILENLNSPFIVQLRYAFQTPAKLYLVMDFMNGGIIYLRRNFHSYRRTFFPSSKGKKV